MSDAPIPYLPGSSVPVPRASCVAPTVCPVVRFADQSWRETVRLQRKDWAKGHPIRQAIRELEEVLRRLRLALEDAERPDDPPPEGA